MAKRTAGTGWGRHVKVVTVVDDGTSEVGTNEWNEDLDNKGILGFSPANATITISANPSGTITPTDSIVVCAAHTGTSGTITKLVNTNTNEYDFLYLFADTGDTITLTHTSGTPSNAGEVVLLGEANKTLDEKVPTIIVRKGNFWYEYGGSPVIAGTGLSKSAATLSIDSTVTTLTGSQTLTNKTLTSPVINTGVSGSAILDSDTMSGASATTLSSSESIKAYVDSQVTAQDLDTAGDSGTGAIDLDSQSLTVSGGSGITTSASNQAITIAGDDATTSAKGVASFSSDNFAVTSGAVTIKDSGVSNDELAGSISNDKLAGSIANAKLANSSITVSDGSSSTATALGGTITFSGTTNEVEVGESSGTITVGLPNNVTVGGNLTVNGTTTTVNTSTLSVEDPIIKLANGNNAADSVDIGLYGLYDTTGSQDVYGGIFRDANDSGKWKIFKDLQAEPTTTVNTSGTGYAVGTLVANIEGNVTGSSGSTTGNAATATALATARTIGGTSFDGTANIAVALSTQATTVTSTANDSTNETVYPTFVDGQSGAQDVETDVGFTYNPSTGTLTAAAFAGALTGDVTGNASGTAATVTGGTQASITNTANLVETGALNAGSITSGFGTIDTGSSAITTTGGFNGKLVSSVQDAVKLSPHGSSAGNTGEIQFLELAANGTNKISIKAPDTIASDVVLTLPVNDGDADDVLKTNGSGVLSWGSGGGGATATHDFTLQAYNYTATDYTSSGASTTRYLHVRPLKKADGTEDTNNEGVFIKIKKNGTHNTEVQIA